MATTESQTTVLSICVCVVSCLKAVLCVCVCVVSLDDLYARFLLREIYGCFLLNEKEKSIFHI